MWLGDATPARVASLTPSRMVPKLNTFVKEGTTRRPSAIRNGVLEEGEGARALTCEESQEPSRWLNHHPLWWD
jgi:hypothetical protein